MLSLKDKVFLNFKKVCGSIKQKKLRRPLIIKRLGASPLYSNAARDMRKKSASVITQALPSVNWFEDLIPGDKILINRTDSFFFMSCE